MKFKDFRLHAATLHYYLKEGKQNDSSVLTELGVLLKMSRNLI